jgi:RNA polymerase sigma-70 factor (ECF subfamily)
VACDPFSTWRIFRSVTRADAFPAFCSGPQGDPLEALFRAHEVALFTLARRMSSCDADAEDAVQETFLEVSRSLSRFRAEGDVAHWLKRICASKVLMRLRRDRWLTDSPAPEAAAAPRDRLDLEQALAALAPAPRAVVWLHDVEGFTHEEIASEAGMTPSWSKSQLSRAHARLRALLGEDKEVAP